MKTFIVYNLDTRLPVAVGEAIKAEWARFEAAAKTNIHAENLIAEEISLSEMLELSLKRFVAGAVYAIRVIPSRPERF